MGYLALLVLFLRSDAVTNSFGILNASLYSKNFITAMSFYEAIFMDLSL